jgi:hypothetical protein
MSLIKFLILSLVSLFFIACSTKQPEEIIVPASLTTELNNQNTYEDKVRLQKEIIKRQELEKQRQEQELLDLERQKIYNDSLKRFE